MPLFIQEKISAFNKPVVKEEEVRREQMKKASFLAKLNKFQASESLAKENKDTESLRYNSDLQRYNTINARIVWRFSRKESHLPLIMNKMNLKGLSHEMDLAIDDRCMVG